jgi:hypothetical protein
MNYDQLINNWHSKASDEDYFSKFVFEYLAFVAYLTKKAFRDVRNDRAAIQRLKQDNAIRNQYLEKIESEPELKNAWETISIELKSYRLGDASRSGDEVEEIKWWNCSHADLQEKTKEEHDQAMGVIHSLIDWENMVEFWYAIRNNLFHGGKNPEDERDQLLVQNGYKTLRPLVEMLLSNVNHGQSA